jgi:hypothetical protein
MIPLKDSIEIKATPEKVFDWFLHFDKNYLEWHPDHVKANFITKNKMEVGAVLYTEEYLHGELHKLKFRCTKVEPGRSIEFKVLFPMSLICPKGSFLFEPNGNNCIFTAFLYFRMGKIMSKIAKKQVNGLKNHMREEGENLKKLFEK